LLVEFHPFIEAKLVATADLPQTGDAGFNGYAAPEKPFVLIDLAEERRPWADKRNISDEGVPELGEFVDAGFTNEASDSGYAGVFLDLEHGSVDLVLIGEGFLLILGIDHHGAELKELEFALVHAHALLGE